MKIIGLAYREGIEKIILKSDSSLRNGRKPFYSPENMLRAAVHPCIAFRIGRMGKHILPQYAWRYIDSYAPSLHIEDWDTVQNAHREQTDLTLATAMDYSQPVGEWILVKDIDLESKNPHSEAYNKSRFTFYKHNKVSDIANDEVIADKIILHLTDRIEDVIAKISDVLTLRQGDIVFLASKAAPFIVRENNCITASMGDKENLLFCKIK